MTSARFPGLAGATQSCAHVLPSTSRTGSLVYWIVFILNSPEGINLSVLFTLIGSAFITAGARQVSQIKSWTDQWLQRVRKSFAKNDLELLASPFFVFPKEEGPIWDIFSEYREAFWPRQWQLYLPIWEVRVWLWCSNYGEVITSSDNHCTATLSHACPWWVQGGQGAGLRGQDESHGCISGELKCSENLCKVNYQLKMVCKCQMCSPDSEWSYNWDRTGWAEPAGISSKWNNSLGFSCGDSWEWRQYSFQHLNVFSSPTFPWHLLWGQSTALHLRGPLFTWNQGILASECFAINH